MTAYHRPRILDDALELLVDQPLRIAAGCTDLFPATQDRALPEATLDITAIPELRGVSRTEAGWRIGSTTTWTDILQAELPPAFDGLKLAAREVGSVQIQNAGTVAGNLCTASPAGDGIPCLMTLDATVELRSATATRSLKLTDFLTGARQTALKPDELVTAFRVPAEAAQGRSTFLKLGARKYLVISIAMVAARLEIDGGTIHDAALAIGACSPIAARLTALEQRLRGTLLTRAPDLVSQDLVAPHLAPIDDIRADAGYRLQAATELTRRALTALAAPQAKAA